MNSESPSDTSKFLSYVLRHEPQAIGLQLDSEGWANLDALITGAAASGRRLDIDTIRAVVAGSDKKRFSLSDDGRRIRAVQGHSTTQVQLQHVQKRPPERLYHGTASRFLEAIEAQGLVAGVRHHVHLSQDVETALQVGQRYGSPVILAVEALRMHEQGFPFFQADNGVWLTQAVPAEFLQRT